MKMVSTHVGGLVAGILLAVCAPIAAGQTTPQTPPKAQLGIAVRILSPTRGADFAGYTQDLVMTLRRNAIASLPDSVKAGQTGLVAIIVQVRADGTFLNPDPKIDRSSNREALDTVAIAAVRASAPFPRFPTGFEGASVELRIVFYYNIPFKNPIPSPEPAKPDADGDSPNSR